jgi:hypothetical protein
MHISPWLIQRSSQIVAAEAATHMFNFAMLQIVCSISRSGGIQPKNAGGTPGLPV